MLLTEWLFALTLLKWPLWASRIPLEDFAGVTLVIEDTEDPDDPDDTGVPDGPYDLYDPRVIDDHNDQDESFLKTCRS